MAGASLGEKNVSLIKMELNRRIKTKTRCVVIIIVHSFFIIRSCSMPLNKSQKSDLKSLDFALDRLFMKLFKSVNIEIVRECQKMLVSSCPMLSSIIDAVNLLVSTMLV